MAMRNVFDRLAQNPQSLGRYRIRPLVALRAFRKLAANKEDTLQVFIFIRALAGRSLERQYFALLRSAEGGREAYRAPELADRFSDKVWLAGFSDGTVGAQYRRFLGLRDLSADGLADESRRLGETDIDAAHPIAWFARRQRDVHDVWHVLTGYGTDALGEACVLAFTYGQTGNIALALLSFAATLELKRRCPRVRYLRAWLEAYYHGRSAAPLIAVDYEALFGERLERARAYLGIARPHHYERIPPASRNAELYPAENVLDGYWPRSV